MKQTLLVEKCKSRKDKNGRYICEYCQIPCEDVKREDCVLIEEYRIAGSNKGEE